MTLSAYLPRLYAYRYAIAHVLNGVLFVLAIVGGISTEFAPLAALWPFPDAWRTYALVIHGSLGAAILAVKRFWIAFRQTLPDRDADGHPDAVDEAPDDPSRPTPPRGAA